MTEDELSAAVREMFDPADDLPPMLPEHVVPSLAWHVDAALFDLWNLHEAVDAIDADHPALTKFSNVAGLLDLVAMEIAVMADDLGIRIPPQSPAFDC